MNNEQMDALGLFAPMCEGENDWSDHTPRTEQTGEQEGAPAAGEQSKNLREEGFRALMEGEYKDLFAAYFQQTFNRRFKEHKQIKAELEGAKRILSAIKACYGKETEEELLDTIRAETVLKNAPTEVQKPLPKEGDGVSCTDIERARAEAEARLLAQIRARGLRPAENGVCAVGGSVSFTGRLTREERADIARRAAEGERITL